MNIFQIYEALLSHRGSPLGEIQEQYRFLSRELHPDKGGDSAHFAEVSMAWSHLKTPERRAALDKKLAFLGNKCPTCDGEGYIMKQKSFTHSLKLPCVRCRGAGYQEV